MSFFGVVARRLAAVAVGEGTGELLWDCIERVGIGRVGLSIGAGECAESVQL